MPSLTVRPATDRDTLADWHSVDVAVCSADDPDLPADPLSELLGGLTTPAPGVEVTRWVGYAGSEPVGICEVELPTSENQSLAVIEVLAVHPQWRRRGVGRLLAEHVLSACRAAGRRAVYAEVPAPLSGEVPGRALAAAFGGRYVATDIRRVLRVGEVAQDVLDAGVGAASAGYRLEQWTGLAAEADIPDLPRLLVRMSLDARYDDDWEPTRWTVDRYRRHIAHLTARGRELLVTAVRHLPSGHLVGYTVLSVNATQPRVAYQWDTLVDPDHRGHRLGLAMKAANLRLLRQASPATEVVNTWNAEDNQPMIAINERLGFRPASRLLTYRMPLGGRARSPSGRAAQQVAGGGLDLGLADQHQIRGVAERDETVGRGDPRH